VHLWDPEDYHKSSSEQQKWARELIAKLDLVGNERVLDIGCGDGKVTAEIARQLPSGWVLGLDSSEKMIRFAQKSFPPEDIPNLAFRLGDAARLDFQSEFEVVVSFACLHWVIDHLPVARGIERSLKPSGKALLQFGGKGNATAVLEVADHVISTGRWIRYFQHFSSPWGFYGPEEYRGWLASTHLQVRRLELVPKDMIPIPGESLKKSSRRLFKKWWIATWKAIPRIVTETFTSK